jgi:hypothetical protein
MLMIVSLTIVRYRKAFIPVALLAMAIHRLPLQRQKGCTFWKLLGSGKNGVFTLSPDWQQWGLLAVWQDREDFDNFNQNSFVSRWWDRFTYEKWTVLLQPIQSHGKWGGQEPFSNDDYIKPDDGLVAVLTHGTIKRGRLQSFWSSVSDVGGSLTKSPGLILSLNIGETHYIAATFSVWQNTHDMKAFAYTGAHAGVIKKARDEHWLSEELFARLKPIQSFGAINGNDPLAGML